MAIVNTAEIIKHRIEVLYARDPSANANIIRKLNRQLMKLEKEAK